MESVSSTKLPTGTDVQKAASCARCARVGAAIGGVEPSPWADWIPIDADLWPAIVEAWAAAARAQQASVRCPDCDRAAVRTHRELLISRAGAPPFAFDCLDCNDLFAGHRGPVNGTRATYTAPSPPYADSCRGCGRDIEELSVDRGWREPIHRIAIAIARPALGPRERALAAIGCASCCAILEGATSGVPQSIHGKPGALRFQPTSLEHVTRQLGQWDGVPRRRVCVRCGRTIRFLRGFVEVEP